MSRLFKNRKETYLIVLLGKYPPNVVDFIKAAIAPNGDFRYSLGTNSIVILIESNFRLNEIDICAKSRFDGFLDHYIAFKRSKMADNHYLFSMNKMLFNNLYNLPSDKTIPQRLAEMDTTLNILIHSRDEYNKFIDDVTEEVRKGMLEGSDDVIEQPVITPVINQIDELNRILDKVAELGYDNITNEEKITLSKFK